MGNSISSIPDLLSNQDFQALPLPEKNKVLMKFSDFAMMPAPERAKALDVIHYNPQIGPQAGTEEEEGLYSGMARRLLGTTQPLTDLGQMIAHPIETAKQVPGAVANIPAVLGAQQQLDALKNVIPSLRTGKYGEAVGSALEGVIPIAGPLAANIGSGIGTGSVTGNFNEPMRDVAAVGYGALAGKLAPEAEATVKGKVAALLAPNEAKVTAVRASNLASALEMGGKAAKSTMTYEDVAQPMLNDFRAEAAKQGIQASDFKGRNGYAAAKSITQGVRTAYNNAYESLIDPIREQPAGVAAQAAARDVISKMSGDAQLLDELTKSGNVGKLNDLAQRVGQAKTVGELDDLRIELNRLSAKYEARPEAGQYQSPLFQESLSSAADSIRKSLYRDIAKRYQGVLTEADLRELQINHGAAIEADQLMTNTASAISRAGSAEQAPATLLERLRGSAYRATMSPRHAVGGMIERAFPPSDVELFNARMQRVVKGAEAGEGRTLPSGPPPEQRLLPAGPLITPPPKDISGISVVRGKFTPIPHPLPEGALGLTLPKSNMGFSVDELRDMALSPDFPENLTKALDVRRLRGRSITPKENK